MTTSWIFCSTSHSVNSRSWSGLLPNCRRSRIVFPFGRNIGHHHGQHLLMNIDSRYLVRHNPPDWNGERAVSYLNRVTWLSPLPPEETTPNCSLSPARSGSDS